MVGEAEGAFVGRTVGDKETGAAVGVPVETGALDGDWVGTELTGELVGVSVGTGVVTGAFPQYDLLSFGQHPQV